MARFFTRTGDSCFTYVCGERISKSAELVEACGALDELNSLLGLARAESWDKKLDRVLEGLQRDLFTAGADLVLPFEDRKARRVRPAHIKRLERLVHAFSRSLAAPKGFVLPAGSRSAALLHVARAVSRRAEVLATRLSEKRPINPHLLVFLNRISSLLYVLALYSNKKAGVREKLVPKLSK